MPGGTDAPGGAESRRGERSRRPKRPFGEDLNAAGGMGTRKWVPRVDKKGRPTPGDGEVAGSDAAPAVAAGGVNTARDEDRAPQQMVVDTGHVPEGAAGGVGAEHAAGAAPGGAPGAVDVVDVLLAKVLWVLLRVKHHYLPVAETAGRATLVEGTERSATGHACAVASHLQRLTTQAVGLLAPSVDVAQQNRRAAVAHSDECQILLRALGLSAEPGLVFEPVGEAPAGGGGASSAAGGADDGVLHWSAVHHHTDDAKVGVQVVLGHVRSLIDALAASSVSPTPTVIPASPRQSPPPCAGGDVLPVENLVAWCGLPQSECVGLLAKLRAHVASVVGPLVARVKTHSERKGPLDPGGRPSMREAFRGTALNVHD
eukprot:Tamp_02454.p1 GENE.Tamp_02454~~Tamp_02454.p1  ORF type:complete len:372 (+),score=59.78 Tamp_02454:70-1185(+)